MSLSTYGDLYDADVAAKAKLTADAAAAQAAAATVVTSTQSVHDTEAALVAALGSTSLVIGPDANGAFQIVQAKDGAIVTSPAVGPSAPLPAPEPEPAPAG